MEKVSHVLHEEIDRTDEIEPGRFQDCVWLGPVRRSRRDVEVRLPKHPLEVLMEEILDINWLLRPNERLVPDA